jgi:hypothetical protein
VQSTELVNNIIGHISNRNLTKSSVLEEADQTNLRRDVIEIRTCDAAGAAEDVQGAHVLLILMDCCALEDPDPRVAQGM